MKNLGKAQLDLGRKDEAAATAEAQVDIYKQLAEADLRYLPNLAASLSNLCNLLSDLGRHDEALGPAEYAAGVYQWLTKADPVAFLPDFADALVLQPGFVIYGVAA